MAFVSASTRLDKKRKLFCEEYSALAFRNAAQAARNIGVPHKSAPARACEWLEEPDVEAYVKELAEARFYDAQIRSEDLIAELKAVAFGRVSDFATIRTVEEATEEGGKILNREVVFTSFDQLPENKLKALSEVGERRTKWGSQVYVRMHDKLAAIKQLRDIEGLAAPVQHEVTQQVTYSLKRKHKRPTDDN